MSTHVVLKRQFHLIHQLNLMAKGKGNGDNQAQAIKGRDSGNQSNDQKAGNIGTDANKNQNKRINKFCEEG